MRYDGMTETLKTELGEILKWDEGDALLGDDAIAALRIACYFAHEIADGTDAEARRADEFVNQLRGILWMHNAKL